MSTPLSGQPLSPEEEQLLKESAGFWRKVWDETPVQTYTRLEEAAKQLIALTTGLQGLYVAIFAFSSLRTQVEAARWLVPGWVLLLFFFTPLCCWQISFYAATRVFLRRVRPSINLNEFSPDAWQKVKQEYGRVNEEKLHYLQRAHLWLMISFVLVLLAVVLFVLLPAPPAGTTH
jgi:hypothetical protein